MASIKANALGIVLAFAARAVVEDGVQTLPLPASGGEYAKVGLAGIMVGSSIGSGCATYDELTARKRALDIVVDALTQEGVNADWNVHGFDGTSPAQIRDTFVLGVAKRARDRFKQVCETELTAVPAQPRALALA